MLAMLGSARDLGRLQEIGAVLLRHGFGDLARRLGIALPWKGRDAAPTLEAPQRVRLALQELGPTFVKLGQILATRIDLLPPDWIAELEKLQDQAPPAAWDAVRAQLVEDLGVAPEELFSGFDPVPVAAGSIAQVHRARLADGTEVAVKARRPGIAPVVEADLRLLARLAALLESHVEGFARFHPREVVRQFTRTLRSELDLAAECRNAERVAQSFRDDPTVVVPEVYWHWTSERVNVQAFVDGTPSRDPEALAAAGLDRRVLAQRGAHAMLKMVLEDGFFHADPHPGNVFYLPGNRVAFIDFGMVGHLSERRRDELVRLLAGLVGRDADDVVEVLLDWAGGVPVDAAKLAADIDAFIDRYHGIALKDLRMGAMLADMTALLREHALALPADLALVLKACATLETYGRELDPQFDMVGAAAPFLRAATLARGGPLNLAKRGWHTLGALGDILGDLPRDLRGLARSARSGRLQAHVDVTGLPAFGRQLDTAANRLALGIVTAALIVGSSIVMTIEGGPLLFGMPLFGALGFAGAFVGGAWLFVSILRSGGGR
ncbi:MAG TPA: AarF/UbiB family protein [Burkholderiales bacterium]